MIRVQNLTSKVASFILIFIVCSIFTPDARARSDIIYASDWEADWPFPNENSGRLYCKSLGGGKKAVWMNGDEGTYALNGQAMDWAERGDLVGADGGPWKKGRDHTNNHGGLLKIIQFGLGLC